MVGREWRSILIADGDLGLINITKGIDQPCAMVLCTMIYLEWIS